MLNGIWQDTRFALRMLRRQRGFATIAVLTLAVGIGANIAIITVGDAVLLRPLPYPDADRLVALRYSPVSSVSSTSNTGLASVLDLADWQARATSFEAIAGYRMRTVDLTGGASSERLRGLWVTSDFFKVFGVTNLRGRSFTPGDRQRCRVARNTAEAAAIRRIAIGRSSCQKNLLLRASGLFFALCAIRVNTMTRAIRALASRPGFTITAIVTLAL